MSNKHLAHDMHDAHTPSAFAQWNESCALATQGHGTAKGEHVFGMVMGVCRPSEGKCSASALTPPPLPHDRVPYQPLRPLPLWPLTPHDHLTGFPPPPRRAFDPASLISPSHSPAPSPSPSPLSSLLLLRSPPFPSPPLSACDRRL